MVTFIKQRKDSLKEMQSFWYDLISKSGFIDIEDVSRPDRPLKKWDSFRHIGVSYQILKKRNEEYQSRIESFLHHSEFDEICRLFITYKKGESDALTASDIKKIWEMHCEGKTERAIATALYRSKTCVHSILERLRQWMNLL